MNANQLPKSLIAEQRAMAKRARAKMTNRDIASSRIAHRVIRSRDFLASKTIGCYLPVRDEVDTSSIILRSWRAKKRIFAPVTGLRGQMMFREMQPDTPLIRNSFGLLEPATGEIISPEAIDVVITPLVAFDDERNRIGMGGGYFDRCFAFLKHRHYWRRPKLIGVAFACQKVEQIVPNPWDVPLYRVFTEKN